jgi:2-isopropylmalate synthase
MERNISPYFKILMFRVTIAKDEKSKCKTDATIKIGVNGKTKITSEEGEGPIDALNKASRKALAGFFPKLNLKLVDFKVGIAEGKGTDAIVRVLIKSKVKEEILETEGVSNDVVEASWKALEESYHYALHTLLQKEK